MREWSDTRAQTELWMAVSDVQGAWFWSACRGRTCCPFRQVCTDMVQQAMHAAQVLLARVESCLPLLVQHGACSSYRVDGGAALCGRKLCSEQ